MAPISSSNKFCNAILYVVLSVFSTSVIAVPLHSEICYEATILNDVAVMMRIEKIAERLKKLGKKGNLNEAIDLMFDAKHEVEAYTKTPISLDAKLNEVYNKYSREGGKIPKKQWAKFCKKLKYKEKKAKFHAEYVAMVITTNGELNYEDELLLYQMKHGENDKNEGKCELEELPIGVALGITIALCGAFIYCLPITGAQYVGGWVFAYGMGLAVPYGIDKAQEVQDRKKVK